MRRFIIPGCFLLLLIIPQAVSARVAIIISERNPVFETVAETCEAEIAALSPGMQVRRYDLSRASDTQAVRKEILNFYPTINFAIGREAADLCASMSLFPFIFTMVLNPERAGLVDTTGKATGYSTGIRILISPFSQFRELKRKIPTTQIIATLYSHDSVEIVEQAKIAASKLGLTLEAERVDGLDNVSTNFRELTRRNIDTYWMIVDTRVLSKDTLDYLIHGCAIREINFLTFNPNHIQLGASIAVYLDYPGLGKQAAEIIQEVFAGTKINDIPIQEAKYTKTSVHPQNIFRSVPD